MSMTPARTGTSRRPQTTPRSRRRGYSSLDPGRYGCLVASADLSSLRGKRVLITGAARGIGAALAEQLASCGARLALIGLEPETLAAVAERCGEGTFVAECDVSDNEQ